MSAMTSGAQTVNREMLAAEAMSIMERHKISALVIVDDHGAIHGVVTLLALLKAGIS
jgi:arabinose-5-phosphate isomerase